MVLSPSSHVTLCSMTTTSDCDLQISTSQVSRFLSVFVSNGLHSVGHLSDVAVVNDVDAITN
jgi:hypothetical protein